VGTAQATQWYRRGRRRYARRDRAPRTNVWCRPRLEPLEPRIALSFSPTGLEQELFQLVNRFRTDPQGELSRLVNNLNPISSLDPYINLQLQYWSVNGSTLAGQWQGLTPVPPLAWSEALYDSAHDHNLAMLAHDGQQHQFPGESDPGQRMRDSGYNWQRWGENIYAYPRSAMETHGGFVIDWGAGPAGIQDPPNHRIRLLKKEFVHIGVAIDDVGYDAARSVGPLIVTQDLATPLVATSAYVVGAVYRQKDGSPWYVAGSGYGSVRIVFEGAGGTFETTSMQAGGYQIQLPPGTYRGHATGGNLPVPLVSDEFVAGGANVAVDFVYPVDRGSVPVAMDDAFVTDLSTSRTFNVLANDRDVDGRLIPSTLSIVTGPTSGEVQVNAETGWVTYIPDGGFSGLDKFVYQIRDDDGLTSNSANVRVVVIDLDDRPWQNPVNRLDVNVDETVSPVDALQVINALSTGQGSKLPVPPPADNLPPPLLDVTGDNLLSPRDALWIINYLTNSGSGEGESALAAFSGGGVPETQLSGSGFRGALVRWPVVAAGEMRRSLEQPAVSGLPREIATAVPLRPFTTLEAGLYAESTTRYRAAVMDPTLPACRTRRTLFDAVEAMDHEVFRSWPDQLATWWLRF
jgi:hypothetical protein